MLVRQSNTNPLQRPLSFSNLISGAQPVLPIPILEFQLSHHLLDPRERSDLKLYQNEPGISQYPSPFKTHIDTKALPFDRRFYLREVNHDTCSAIRAEPMRLYLAAETVG